MVSTADKEGGIGIVNDGVVDGTTVFEEPGGIESKNDDVLMGTALVVVLGATRREEMNQLQAESVCWLNH